MFLTAFPSPGFLLGSVPWCSPCLMCDLNFSLERLRSPPHPRDPKVHDDEDSCVFSFAFFVLGISAPELTLGLWRNDSPSSLTSFWIS